MVVLKSIITCVLRINLFIFFSSRLIFIPFSIKQMFLCCFTGVLRSYDLSSLLSKKMNIFKNLPNAFQYNFRRIYQN